MDRNLMDLGALRGAPTAFAGNNLVFSSVLRVRTDQKRLQNTFFGDRSRKFVQSRFIEMPARLQSRRRQQIERQAGHGQV